MNKVYKLAISLLVIVLIITAMYFNKSDKSDITKFSYYEYFDTLIDISIYDKVEDKEIVETLITNKLSEIDKMASMFVGSGNGVYELNQNNTVDNEELSKLLTYAISYYNDYSNQFNIALGPVIGVWKDALEECNENNNCYVPTYETLQESGNINANDIVIDGSVVNIKDDMTIDLGGIAKGYFTDEVAKVLKENGYEHFLINAGGNIYGSSKANGDKFNISVVDPTDNTNSFINLYVKNKTVVTSGDYERFYEVDNVRYSHLINDETLYPSNYFRSVTIVCDKSIDGDILSTMLFNLEYEEGLKIIESMDGVEAVWYVDSGDVRKSSGIANYEKE